MKLIKFIPLSSILFLLVISCNKEIQIKNCLSKNNGNWNIKTWTVSEFEDNVLKNITTYTNFGSIVFNKDKSGSLKIIKNGTIEVYPFTWLNSKETLTLIMDGNVGIEYKILSKGRKYMKLEYSITYSENGISYREVRVVELIK
jgi:hypothetical protein